LGFSVDLQCFGLYFDLTALKARWSVSRPKSATVTDIDMNVDIDSANIFGSEISMKQQSVLWCKPCFDISNRLGVVYECDGRTDGIVKAIAASNRLDARQKFSPDLFSQK